MHATEHALALAGRQLENAARDCEQQVERGGADTATWRAIHATARDLSTLVLSLAGQSHDLDWAEIDGG